MDDTKVAVTEITDQQRFFTILKALEGIENDARVRLTLSVAHFYGFDKDLED